MIFKTSLLIRPLGLALFSATLLCTEIGLTRLFSTLYYPPYVFIILSLALLGIGLGAALAVGWSALRSERALPIYTALAALAVLGVLAAATAPGGSWPLAALCAAALLPFLFGGLTLAAIFSSHAARSPQLYLADLVGAGAGALLVVPLFNWLGVPGGLLAAAGIMAATGMLLAPRANAWPAWIGSGLIAVALLLHVNGPWLTVDMHAATVEKPEAEQLRSGAQLLTTRWDAFARTDLIDPGGGLPYELYINGAAGSVMPPAAGHPALLQDIGFFPFATEQPERAFVIGPGGGLDVWFGLQSGASEIVAVEVNPASVEMVREYAAYNGDLYGDPAVQVWVDEGRSVLQRGNTRYDLIFLSQVVTLAAERSGYALVENSAYTKEAFALYLDHLTDRGQIALKLYDEPTLTRAVATALAVLRERENISDAEALRHLMVLLDPASDPPVPLLLVRKTPYSRADALSLGAVANEVGFRPLYLPGAWAEAPLDAVAAGERTFAEVVDAAETDLSPTTDNRPFFFQFERGVPAPLRPLLWGMLGLVLVLGAGVGIAQRRVATKPVAAGALYFAGLGMGFIAAEIVFIQQVGLFLGHPTVAITTVLVALLVGGGLGSGLIGRMGAARGGLRRGPLVAVLVGLLAWALLWPVLAQRFVALEEGGRIAVTVAALLPIALCTGMPFPLGLRWIGQTGERYVAMAWAVNGAMSVVGSVCAVALATTLGYRAVLGAAGGAYALALLATWRQKARQRVDVSACRGDAVIHRDTPTP